MKEIINMIKPLLTSVINVQFDTIEWGWFTIHFCEIQAAGYRLEFLYYIVFLLLNIAVNIEPDKKISVFWVTGLKILGWVGTHFFFWKQK